MPSKNIPIGKMVFSASNVATLFGCGFHTTMELYKKYTNPKWEPEEQSESALVSMEFGKHFETPVAKFAAKKLGLGKIRACKTLAFYTEDMPYFICHPDFLVQGGDKKGRRAAIECKCVMPFAEGWGEEKSDKIPKNYYIQCQCYFATGVPVDVVYVACMRGNRVYTYEVLPDSEIIDEIRRRVAKTHEFFERGIVPQTEGYEETVSYYSKQVDLESEGIGANDEIVAIYEKLSKVHKIKTLAEAKEMALKTTLMQHLGSNLSYLVTENGKIRKICYWSERSGYPVFDKELFKKEHPGIDPEQYMTTKTYRQFNVNYPRNGKEKNNG